MEANNNSQPIKVAIVDDHYIILDGMEKIIAESGFAVLSGKAGTVAGCRGPRGSLRQAVPVRRSRYTAEKRAEQTGYTHEAGARTAEAACRRSYQQGNIRKDESRL